MKARGLLASLGRSAGGWVALTIAASMLVCASVVGLQLYQERSLSRAAAIVGDLRLARIDLYQGVMHSVLGDRRDSPWEAARGQALIRQALQEFRSSLHRIPDGPAADALERQLQAFDRALAALHRTDPRAELDLRIALFRLNGAALQVDQQARIELAALRQSQREAFWLVLGLAAALLGLISAAAVHLRRREAAAAAARYESEQRFALLFEQNPEPTLVHAAGRVELANPAALRALGAANAQELQAVPMMSLVGEADRARVATALAGLDKAPGVAVSPGYTIMRRLDGSEFSVESATASFRQGAGLRMLSVFHDISERLASLALLKATLQSTDNGMLVAGAGGELLLWNDRLLALPGGQAAVAEASEAAALATIALQEPPPPGAAPASRVVRRPDGCYVETHWQPMRIGGRPAGRVWSFRDVTERERALHDAQAREQELERRVQERTADLAQAYADLQTFSDAVSHDLRAPLAAVDMFATTVLRKYGDSLAPQARHYLDRVLAGAASMKDMIEGLLELSHHARAPVHRRPLDLGRMAREAFDVQAQSLAGRRVHFTVAEDLRCSGDPVLVATLLQNLIGNAIKYSRGRDPARIEVGVVQEAGEQRFFVRDNGAGFDPAYAARLFKPFSRLHGTDEFEGHGIGLATVSRIVARHGGRVWAQGAEGQGATFWFTLG